MEVFVYGPEALRLWLEKGRADRRPVLDKLMGEGIPLIGGVMAQSLGDESRRVLGDEFSLVAWAGSDHDPAELEQCIRAVLDAAGGYVQESFIHGLRPSDL